MIPKRIVVIGGSTVHGQGDPDGGGFVARLRRWHETLIVDSNRVFNLGIGGDGVCEMLARGPGECRVRRPDLIILYPGLNDTRRVGGPDAPPQHSFESIRETLKRSFLS
jgi:lysophospholipase L1-like esterase